jgi:hypothetical protein
VHPAYFAFIDKQFHLVKASETDDSTLDKIEIPDFKRGPHFGLIFVGTRMAE